MFEEVPEHIEWLGHAPSGRKIGRVIDEGGFARYITLDTVPGIKYRYAEVLDGKNCVSDVLHALTLEYERATCIADACITGAEKINRDHFGGDKKDE